MTAVQPNTGSYIPNYDTEQSLTGAPQYTVEQIMHDMTFIQHLPSPYSRGMFTQP